MKHFLNIWKGFLIVLVFILCAAQVGRARAATIQSMIDNAPNNGTVIIPAGTYTENLKVSKNITLTGDSSSPTILQPAGAGQPVISVDLGYNLTINSLEVTGGSSDNGGGIYLDGGSLTLNYCRIDHNTATYFGGGVYQSGPSGSVTATSSQIDHNVATNYDGGGLYVSGSATLSSTDLIDNQANRHGGGVQLAGSIQLTNGHINNNQAITGNGGGVGLNNNLSINGTQFNNNTAGDSGGGLTQWNSGETVSILNAVFNDNTAVNKGGGAYLGSHATLTSSTFSGNTVNSHGSADALGGGLFAPDGLVGSHLTFNGNSAQCQACFFSDGGGLYVDRLGTDSSSISSSAFDGNLAWDGGGIYSTANVLLTVTDSTFTNNNNTGIGYGGGVEAYWLEGDRLLFQNNIAKNKGGGVFGSAHLVLKDSRFINNTATQSGGGAIYWWKGTFNGTNLLFLQNNSSLGAALLLDGGTAELDFATIARPTNTNTDPAIELANSGTLTLKDSIISSYGTGVNGNAGTTLTEDYNLFNNTINMQSGGTLNHGGNSIINQDPHFVNPSAGDYHLLSSSPAIGKGINLGVPADLDGHARSGRWDIGAYQYWAFVYLPLIIR